MFSNKKRQILGFEGSVFWGIDTSFQIPNNFVEFRARIGLPRTTRLVEQSPSRVTEGSWVLARGVEGEWRGGRGSC